MLKKTCLLLFLSFAVQLNILPEINATVGLFAPDRYEGIPEACLLAMDFGYCRAKVKRYYFDMRRMKCAMFFWGGCAGNSNNFKSMEECNRVCLDPYTEFNGGNIYEDRQNNEQKYIALSADNSGRHNNRIKSSSKNSNNSDSNHNNNNHNHNNYISNANKNSSSNNNNSNSKIAANNHQNSTVNYVNTNAGFSSNYNNNNNKDYNINNKPNKYLFNNNNLRKSFTLTKQHQDTSGNTSSAEKIYDEDDYEI